jgi:hypothetical protein
MVHRVVIASCTAVLVMVTSAVASACDTSSWLHVPGAADPGAVVTVRGGGFDAGPVALVWDRPTGQVVGAGVAGPDGGLAVEVTIPRSAAGAHKVIAVPQDESGSPVDTHAWTDVVVAAAPVQPAAAPAPDGPANGGPSLLGAAALALAAAAGVVLGLGARRRGAATDPDAAGRNGDQLDRELEVLLEGNAVTTAGAAGVSSRRTTDTA